MTLVEPLCETNGRSRPRNHDVTLSEAAFASALIVNLTVRHLFPIDHTGHNVGDPTREQLVNGPDVLFADCCVCSVIPAQRAAGLNPNVALRDE